MLRCAVPENPPMIRQHHAILRLLQDDDPATVGMLEGTLRTDPPWSIDGPADYRLPAGGRTTFALRFQPRQKGPFRGEVRFSSDPTSATQLRGAAEAAIRFDPPKIELGYGAGETGRTGAFAVTNRSASEVSLAFSGSDRLQFGRQLKLAPHETQQVQVALPADDPLGLSAEIRAEPHDNPDRPRR